LDSVTPRQQNAATRTATSAENTVTVAAASADPRIATVDGRAAVRLEPHRVDPRAAPRISHASTVNAAMPIEFVVKPVAAAGNPALKERVATTRAFAERVVVLVATRAWMSRAVPPTKSVATPAAPPVNPAPAASVAENHVETLAAAAGKPAEPSAISSFAAPIPTSPQ